MIYIPLKHKTNTINPFISNLIQIGDFNISLNLNNNKTDIISVKNSKVSYTLDDISVTDISIIPIVSKKEIKLNLNKLKISSFNKYSQIELLMLTALDEILLNYPATLVLNNKINGEIGNNILNYSYNSIKKTSSFLVNTNFIINPLNINYLKLDVADEGFAPYRILKNYFTDYSFLINDVRYNIVGFEGSDRYQNTSIKFEVDGDIFPNVNNSVVCYITPKQQLYDTFKSSSSELTNLLLEKQTTENFEITFESFNEEKNLIYNQTFLFPKYDVFNPDFLTNKFLTFKDELINFIIKEDNINTNILKRKYVESNLLLPFIESISQENYSEKFEAILDIYSFSFDDRFKFIENIKNLHILTYDKVSNISDDMLDIYLDMLGLNIYENLNVEKKRILLLNSSWLLKSKGTRKAIEFLLMLLNIPPQLVRFDEYVNVSESIDYDLYEKFYKLYYGNNDIKNINKNGEPIYNPEIVFESQEYWNQFLNLDEKLNGKFFTEVKNYNNKETIYDYNFESTGTTFDYFLYSSNCYDVTSSIITDTLKENLYDECGCLVDTVDKTIQLNILPKDLYPSCVVPIIDVWQSCNNNIININVDVYGGVPPYTFHGIDPNENYESGIDFSIYVTDSLGCNSLTTTGTTSCYNIDCEENPIIVNLDYICNQDEFGYNNGTATVILIASGGTPPYIINGDENGTILDNNSIIITEVIDSVGCSSGIISKQIECAEHNCVNIILESTGECTSNIRISDVKVNVTYDLYNIPNTTSVDTVTMMISSAHIYGGNNTEIFNSESGIKTITLNMPSLSTEILTVVLDIMLLDGCTYSETYVLEVDCSNINTPNTYTNTLEPI